ncbi:MAG: helix-turn-helix domain-containing protein [Bacteroidota bacterium]
MKISFLSLIYLIGAVQGLILLLGININKPGRGALRQAMSVLLIVVSLAMVYYIILINRAGQVYSYVHTVGTAAWMALCPAYYLLCCCLVNPEYRLRRRHLSYFSVSLFFVLEELLVRLGLPFRLYDWINDPLLFVDIWMGLFFGTGIFFIYRSVRLLSRNPQNKSILQLRWLAYALLLVLFVFGLVFIKVRAAYPFLFECVLIGLFELFIFAFLYKVFAVVTWPSIFQTAKYGNKVFDQDKLAKLALRLEKVMQQQQPYLDKKLKLVDLSAMTGIPTNDLSQLFNKHYESGFYEYINTYRLQHLEQLILQAESEKYTIAALAEQSGFNNKATFYKVFKKKHNLTPTEYVKKQRGGGGDRS